MAAKLRFGPAGMPLSLKGKALPEGLLYCAKHKLLAFEIEWVRGVRLNKQVAIKAKQIAKQHDILLSAHAPYWINAASPLEEKQQISFRNLWQSVQAAALINASIVVFHPGYYQNLTQEQALTNVYELLKQLQEKMQDNAIEVWLGAETTGKPLQVGTLDEIIWLSKKLKFVKPVIDFAHIHARNNGCIKSKSDYESIIKKIKDELGKKYLEALHCHFSSVSFTAKGEKQHLPIARKQPDFKPLAELIVEKNYKFTIICESPLLDKDAIKMREIVESIKAG